MVAALNAFRPEALTSYPSVAAALAEEQLQGRLRIVPGLVATTSEVQTADIKRRMAEAWELEPLDFYGTTEALILAAGRPGQAGMDVLEDLVIVEVVDEHDRPVAPGVPGHKALLTSLVGRVQPRLRYELTDAVTLAGGPNPLGLPYVRLAAVDGRSDDALTLPGAGGARFPCTRSGCGRRSPSCSRSASTRWCTTRPACTWRWCCARRHRRTPRPGSGAALARELRDAGAVPPPIDVTPVPELRRDPGHGAKLKLIRSVAGGA